MSAMSVDAEQEIEMMEGPEGRTINT
jgi:hypothetical protein